MLQAQRLCGGDIMTALFDPLDGYPKAILGRMWWAVLLRAFAAIVFAFAAFFWLGKSISALTVLFACYAAADGFLSVIGAMRGGGLVARGGLGLAGAASLVTGAIAALLPDITSPMLAMIVGGWAVVRGALEFLSALTLRKVMERDWSLAMIGGLSVLFGGMFVVHPGFEPSIFVRLVSGYALILGLLLILLAFRFLWPLRP
jgi:uncharacterized membrane protein HdeD (DUF308 family)